jgi:THO complex subunit 4
MGLCGWLLTLDQVEVVVASADLIPQPKTLAQRIAQPKVQPKSAATVKKNGNAGKGDAAAAKGKKTTARRGRSGRPVKKTAEELDSEMADYFDANAAADNTAGAGAPAAAAGGDAAMEEDVL